MHGPEVPAEATTVQLQELLAGYNWDDGFATPRAIADHASCDLAVALELFWLAGADELYPGESQPGRFDADWHEFSRLVSRRIVEGHYRRGSGSFKVGLDRVQAYQYRKKGLPDILLSDVEPAED